MTEQVDLYLDEFKDNYNFDIPDPQTPIAPTHLPSLSFQFFDSHPLIPSVALPFQFSTATPMRNEPGE
jgi:hypothetical protein